MDDIDDMEQWGNKEKGKEQWGYNGWILSIIFGWCKIMGMLGPRLGALGWVPLIGKKNVFEGRRSNGQH